jgi:hypothetical protein
MSKKMTIIKTICLVGTIALSSCGGGGDVAAGLTDFGVSPEGLTLKAGDGDFGCSGTAGHETVVTIIGGIPPYRVVSSLPDRVRVSKTEVTGKNPTFAVVTGTGCMEDISVTVLDYHSRSAVFSVTVEKGEELKDAAAAL